MYNIAPEILHTLSLYADEGYRAKDTLYNAAGSITGWREYDRSGKKVRERNETLQNSINRFSLRRPVIADCRAIVFPL